MLHRLGISIDHAELLKIQALQKRFGIRSRSEFFRVLVARYEKLEKEFSTLHQCVDGYLKQPETVHDQDRAFLKSTTKEFKNESW